MQLSEAKRLREEWGDKPCSHPHLVKEYYLGSHTEDYVCTTCGRSFHRSELDKFKAAGSRV